MIVGFRHPGPGLLATAAAAVVVLAWRHRGSTRFAWSLAALGAGLVFGVELLYVDDFYSGNLARMNTVFKAYVHAWVLLGLAAALVVPALVRRARAWSPALAGAVKALAFLAVLAGAVYPVRGVRERCGRLWRPVGFDTRHAFRALYPDDAAAAELLAAQPRGVLLETTGDPYTWSSRFATFTGYPAVVGWGHHEAGWRNTWEPMQTRARRVHEAYEAADLAPLRRMALDLGIRYVVVGQLERERYPAPALEKFTRLPVAVSAGQTTVYRVEAP